MFSKSILGLTLIILVGFFLFFFIGQNRDSNEIDSSGIEANQDSQSGENFSDIVENFISFEFNNEKKLEYKLESKRFITYVDNNKPGMMINPTVTHYDVRNGKKDYLLTSDLGWSLKSGDFLFSGSVNLESKNGEKHVMKSNSFILKRKLGEIVSNNTVKYFGVDNEMVSNGIKIKPNQNFIETIGSTEIISNNGEKILSEDVNIDKSKVNNIYSSKSPTTYISKSEKVLAQGFNYDQNSTVMNLLGRSKIIQNNGAIVDSDSLIVKNKDEYKNKMYKTPNEIKYQSNNLEVNAKGMYFDSDLDTVKLIQDVKATYD